MRGPDFFRKPFWIVLAAALSATGMWLYTQRVLVAYQIVYAAKHQTPRGNLSDLYPRWVGARELLLHGRDPYSAEVTRESQAGYYGRPLDHSLPEEPKDEQGFAYPIYVVFLLAPTITLPFSIVQRVAFWFFFWVTAASIPLWLSFLRRHVALWKQFSVLGFLLASLPFMQGLKLQQISLLVAAIIAAAFALLIAGRPIPAGILFALSTIKPQLVVLLIFWLTVWTFTDWRRRYRCAVSFLVTMAVLLAASEWVSPHWIPRFWHALGEYRRYTSAASLLKQVLPSLWSSILEILAVAAALLFSWSNRRYDERSSRFAAMACLMLAVTVLIVPMTAPYNQIFLLPPILLLAHVWPEIWRRNRACRVLVAIGGVLLVWPWISSVAVAALSFILPAEIIQKAWTVPLWSAIPLPVAVVALMLIYSRSSTNEPAGGQSAA